MTARGVQLAFFNQSGFPPPGVHVEVLCEDNGGVYVPPFNCCYSDTRWISASAGKPLEVKVVGWRMPRPPSVRRR